MFVQKKQNFIDEIKQKLGVLHIQRLKKIESKAEYQQLHQKENIAKDALMEIGDDEEQGENCEEFFERQNEDIKGWRSNRIVNYDERSSWRKTPMRSASTQALALSNRKPNMIPYLKSALQKLESPRQSRKSSKKNRKEQLAEKQQLTPAASTPPLNTIFVTNSLPKSKEQVSFTKKNLKNGMDINIENKPLQTIRNTATNYQRIKRKGSYQHEIDIAYQKQILQQLIKNSSRDSGQCSTSRGIVASKKIQTKKERFFF